LLGKGAFGRVYRCRNRLDTRDYAIKTIRLSANDQEDIQKMLREVKFNARITHRNVVRYFSSWLEHVDEACGGSLEEESDGDGEDSSSSAASTTTSTSKSNVLLHIDNDQQNYKPLTMFIQMELCSMTLQDWLDDAHHHALNDSACLVCFRDILEGLEHIHRQGCLHRDIKPCNIFWKSDIDYFVDRESNLLSDVETRKKSEGYVDRVASLPGCWKIGDFGLATFATTAVTAGNQGLDQESSTSGNSQFTNGVGTITYASPEQQQQSSNQLTSATDIYSLGIVLFELFYPFDTAMERAHLLSLLRRGILPESFLCSRPREVVIPFGVARDTNY
jgi:eukaryotic translation initiation factor 2-alpha kinase 1